MISLQSHNQVLYHLTQLTSAFSPKSTPVPVKVRKQSESTKKILDTGSSNGFVEEAKNDTEALAEWFNVHNIGTNLKMKRNNQWVTLDRLSMNVCKRHTDKSSKWKVSYVSSSSFAKNKQGFPCPQFTEPIILPAIYLSLKPRHRTLCTLSTKSPFKYNVQIRGFKTQRNVKLELEKNQSLINRLKSLFADKKGRDVGTTTMHEFRDSDLDKIKTLLCNAETSTDEQKRIKSAFVEGFETGIQRQIRVRHVWSKLLQPTLILMLCLALLWSAVLTPGNVFRFAINRKSEINPEEIHVTFNDVKGVEEAKEELRNVVEFLKNPEKFSALGGKLPKGVLLAGPPGTGKTLLARAVAGEAGVPFFSAAGPEFDEVLVGQGARRVRDLFKAAKERAPSVIFIDEIDSVGAKRINSALHPYANQTINQLLSEMDGFLQNEGVIVLGATNRPKDLDKALMRPGRFDVEIYVNAPDYRGRKEILELYLSRVLTRDVDAELLAKCTTGFTGADIEAMVNQAALRAAINDAEYVTMHDLECARDKIILGPASKNRIRDEETNRLTAYHEAGHTVVSYFTKDSRPLHKVSIIPYGASLGHTSYLEEKDVFFVTKARLLATLDALMGGRAAEELIFGQDKVTTGALSDFEEATKTAERMVKMFGMSEKVGFRTHTENPNAFSKGNDYGPGTNELIDTEVKRLLQESYERAKNILKTHAKEHKRVADALLKYETLTADDVKAIINDKKPGYEPLNNTTPIVDSTKHSLL